MPSLAISDQLFLLSSTVTPVLADKRGISMSNVIELVPDRSEVNIDERHAQTFRDLETNLRDCVRRTGIAAELMLNASIENDHLRFAVFHSAEMLVALEKEYDARGNSELRGPA
ncbi:hypothetical protein FXB40_01980 [Bradyrhizobium rifense]|uniref:Uncharacterized protein n=1 Tax=Bradyrhizobium rifense TaxID=515499 RepID=A0A5D3L0W9_9BRAD|nr:hypothetical protein [Bradyrhizobium rifense]TYL99629.1 hypothetical protein FXB40_01980 [Bradyrhizobium rifense]